jgi:hypothetical protein
MSPSVFLGFLIYMYITFYDATKLGYRIGCGR